MFSVKFDSFQLWTVAHQAPLSMEFPRQEYWSGLPFPSPGGLPDSGIKPGSPVAPAQAGELFTTESPGKPIFSRQEYWNGLSFPTPGGLPDSGIKLRSPTLQAVSLPSEPPGKPKVKVKVAQSCLTLCDPMDCGILQTRVMEWVAIPFSRGSS